MRFSVSKSVLAVAAVAALLAFGTTARASCGDGILDPGEDCDPAGGAATSCETASNTGPAFTCSPSCECACPSTVTFAADKNDPDSLLDVGWTGIAHSSGVIDGLLSVTVSDCAGTSRPCGVCTLGGPVENTQRCSGGSNSGAACSTASECPGGSCPQVFKSRRCTNDPSVQCASDTPCRALVPTPISKCNAAKKKCIGKYVAAVLKCHEKAEKKGIAVDPVCLSKATAKITGSGKGCFDKNDAKYGAGVDGCGVVGDAPAQLAKADAFVLDVVSDLDPAYPAPVTNKCSATKKKCVGKKAAGLMGCEAKGNKTGSVDPTCTAKQVDKFGGAKGCFPKAELKPPCLTTGDAAAIEGKVDAWVGDAVGGIDDSPAACEFFFGAPLPLSSGGVATCTMNEVNGPLSGTANIETGESVNELNLIAHVFTGITTDQPCPQCNGDGTPNDGVAAGTCDGGDRDGLPCDVNGVSPNVSFGAVSLDCPPLAGANVANLRVGAAGTTGTASMTLSAESPSCRALGFTTNKCFCDTCDNPEATACSSNADCLAVGAAVCGGKRCLSGANAGAPCTTNSECPGGSCTIPGQPTAPNACLPPDGAPDGCQPVGNNRGECTDGPTDTNCAPPEQHRGCTGPTDCPVTGTCVPALRQCFLDMGVVAGNGDCAGGSNEGASCTVDSECPGGACQQRGELIAQGAAVVPVNDQSTPTAAAVFCLGPTGASAVNSVAGLPGPARLRLRGPAQSLP